MTTSAQTWAAELAAALRQVERVAARGQAYKLATSAHELARALEGCCDDDERAVCVADRPLTPPPRRG